ncbi:MAG TPA: hypothetical protein VLY82_00550 [Nitrososphaerales archaeon]|nr:hypothetical protein [Nitrososphaerales archaeon]
MINAWRRRGHEAEFYRTGDVQLRVNGVYFDAFHGARSFREIDVAIPGVGRSLADFWNPHHESPCAHGGPHHPLRGRAKVDAGAGRTNVDKALAA